jgi:hypothetical protein
MTFPSEPTIALYLDEAEVLKDVLGRLEDWLMHCDSCTFEDITTFFNGPGNGRLAVEGLIRLLGNHAVMLGQRLKDVGQ